MSAILVKQSPQHDTGFQQGPINIPADAIWQVLSDFGAACEYRTAVVNCTVEGAGVGALRTLTYADGSMIVERLEALDEAAHRLSYALLADTPFRNCLTTVTVYELPRGQCEVTWPATFDADGLPASEAVAMLEGAFELDSKALQHFLADQGAVTGERPPLSRRSTPHYN